MLRGKKHLPADEGVQVSKIAANSTDHIFCSFTLLTYILPIQRIISQWLIKTDGLIKDSF